ncbi:sensor histidine kinase [Leptospira ilyithenensis]|uniref:histidine kinase n=1 Tax=Leptospira ilyithenensis TaxID=2484901 RepID=A0A4R9LR84_9LEPT|nr:ATP-binding protein [Leptospira ilyithenensis]TGN10490.1 GHKL domain-containing protein [Leptospira ilyithenensis]
MNLTYIRIFLIFAAYFSVSCKKAGPEFPISDGKIDLSGWDLNRQPIVPLRGEWKLYPYLWLDGQTLPSEEPVSIDTSKQNWNSSISKWVDKEGNAWGTYVLSLKLPQNIDTEDILLRSGVYGVAAKFFINRKQIGESGKITKYEYGGEVISTTDRLFALPADLDTSREVLLYIQVSNFHHARGGMWNPPTLGKKAVLESQNNLALVRESFVVGGLILLALYQLSYYCFRRKNPSSVLFILFCFFMATRLTVTGRNIFSVVSAMEDNEISMRLNYFSFFAGSLTGLYYIRSLNPVAIPIRFIHFSGIIYILPILVSIFGSTYYLSLTLYPMISVTFLPIIVCLYVIYQIWKSKLEGREALVIGLLFFFGSVIHDIMLLFTGSLGGEIMSFGLLVFVLSQSFYLSRRHTSAMNLAETNLRAAQYQLVQSEKMSSLGAIVAGVAHEINSPLTVVNVSANNLQTSLETMMKSLSEISKSLDGKNLALFLKLIEQARLPVKHLSYKEERSIRKEIVSFLEEKGSKDPASLAENLLEMGIDHLPLEYSEYLNDSSYEPVWKWAYEFFGLIRKTEGILSASQRVEKIVLSLKLFTHFDPKAEKKLTDIIEGIETVLTVFSHSFKTGIEIVKDYSVVPEIFCYPDELIQVWTNLIHNSIQAMKETGVIKISIRKEYFESENYISISIEDTGRGIPLSLQEKIFEPFFTTKSAGEGTGLGLHITKQVIDKHNGKILLESVQGRTLFRILLPELTLGSPSFSE